MSGGPPSWWLLLCAGFVALIAFVPADTALAKHHREAKPEYRDFAIPRPVKMPQEDAHFYAFLRDFWYEAQRAGIKPAIYDRAVANIALNTRVQDLNLEQPEFVRPIWDYLASAVSEQRIRKGEDALAANAALFARLKNKYGVPREMLAAIWGCETNYGQSGGAFNLFEALATLAYDGPRETYGRTQFIAALEIAQEEHFDPRDMIGSWAGAIGHTQFVPTTFRAQAVDGDGDGKLDLWNSAADALASTASYLKELGWREGEPWGTQVRLPDQFAYDEADPEIRKSRDEWAHEGVRAADGEPLKGGADKGAIFLPAGFRGPAFLTFDNFDALTKYNAASSYALAVGLLSDRLKGGSAIAGDWPRDTYLPTRTELAQMQGDLAVLGFDAGASDGLLGKHTRSGLRAYQKARELPADGFPTMDLFYRIREETRDKRR